MARIGIVFGLLLCGLTFVALVVTVHKSPVQFFPMMLGIPVLFCGVVALNPHRRQIALMASLAVCGIGAIGGALRIAWFLTRMVRHEAVNEYAMDLLIAMTLLCVVYSAITIVSLAAIRRRRRAARRAIVPHHVAETRRPANQPSSVPETPTRESA